MILNDYNKIINEHFNLTDTPTRKCIVALKEDSEQSQMLSALASALYDKIVDKVDDIDFGSIPRSRGDITKVDGFHNTYECLRIMKRLVLEYRQDPTVVDNVIGSIENIKERKAVFMKAYALNIEFPMTLYNLVVAAIENSVSFLISVCIQYVKDPETETMAAAVDRVAYTNAKQNMLYEQLISFNNTCKDGTLDKALNYIITTSHKVHEAYECGLNFDGKASVDTVNFTDRINAPFMTRAPFEDPKDVPDPNVEPLHEEEPTDMTGFEVEPGFGPSLDNGSADDYELDRRDIANEGSLKDDLRNKALDKATGTNKDQRKEIVKSAIKTAIKKGHVVSLDDYDDNGDLKKQSTNEGIGAGILAASMIAAGTIGATMVILKAIITIIIPMMRNIAYKIIVTTAKIGACLQLQADFIEMNAYRLQTSDDYANNPKEMQKVVTKQKKVADKLKKWANKFAIDDKEATKKAMQNIKKDGMMKYKVSDLSDDLPADIYNKSVVF
jgi:hypothetical protein